eukprot:1560002-Lingulodinium_polyedra.AAC.1
MGHVRHEIPARGPTAAQLLHQAACKLGRDPGARGQHALVVETSPLDHQANAVPGDQDARTLHRRSPTWAKEKAAHE